MVPFTQMSGSACQRTSRLRDPMLQFPVDEVDYQDYKLLQWQNELPTALKLDMKELNDSQQPLVRTMTEARIFLATVLHARAHQLRSLIYRPVLYSPARIYENRKHAQIAVDVAKESVQFLKLVDHRTTFVRDEPLFFRDFLISALAGILLAVSNAPSDFSSQLNDEFFSILHLLRTLSSKSPDMARVWNTIKILETVAPRLGLSATNSTDGQNRNYNNGAHDRNDTVINPSNAEIAGKLPTDGIASLNCNSPFWNPGEHGAGLDLVDFNAMQFSTSMFPVQLRNELSILPDSTWQVSQDPVDYTFAESYDTNTMWS